MANHAKPSGSLFLNATRDFDAVFLRECSFAYREAEDWVAFYTVTVFPPRFSEHRNQTFGKGNVIAKIERVGFTRQVSNLFSELTIVGFRWQVDGSLMGSLTILYSAATTIASSFLRGYDVLWFTELMSRFLRFFWYELFCRLRININWMFEKITFAFVVCFLSFKWRWHIYEKCEDVGKYVSRIKLALKLKVVVF